MFGSTLLPDEVRKLSRDELNQYFQRIGVSADDAGKFFAEPSLEVLAEIVRLQVINIHISNYEMQDVSRAQSDHPVSPYFDDIFRKLVVERQHGYCFENNQLLRHVLISLGYKVNFYNAHIIRNNIPKNDAQHVISVIELNGKEYLADAGYGGVAPIPVTELVLNVNQTGCGKTWKTTTESGNTYKITDGNFKFDGVNEENGFIVNHEYSMPDGGEKFWKPLYIFRKKPCDFREFLEANDRVAKNDETTPFKKNVFETAFENDNVRKSLTQDELHITVGGATKLRKPVCSSEKYNKYLGKYFGHPESRQIRDRVTYGNAPNECLLWHRKYKEEKQEKLESSNRKCNL